MSENLHYRILGDSAQVLEITLPPSTTLVGDGGALLYIDHEISLETRDTDGSEDFEQPEANDDDFSEEALPQEENEPEETLKDAFEDFEERDQEGNLLQKLWIATRKAVAKVTKTAEKEEAEEDIAPDDEDDEIPEEATEEASNEAPEEEIISWFITHFTNESEFTRKIAFTTANSGIVLPIDLSDTTDNELIIQTGTFLCARKGIKLEKFLDTGLGVDFTKEKLFKLDKLTGQELVFLQAEGQTLERSLDNDAIRVGLFSIVAFESTLELDLESVVKVQSMNYEDDTQFITLAGTGRYWIQTANVQQFFHRVAPFIFEPNQDGEVLNPPVTAQEQEKIPNLLRGIDDKHEDDLSTFLKQASEDDSHEDEE